MLLRLGMTKHAFFSFNTTLVLNMVLVVVGLFSPLSSCGWVGVLLGPMPSSTLLCGTSCMFAKIGTL